jgi:arylsulfatase A-like enzyme
MGLILQALEEQELREKTLVICTTDHGIAFPRMKCNLHDSGTGVFLMMRGPGGFEGGKVIDAMTSHLDIFPTICDLLQIERPAWLEGESLLPLVRGEQEQIHDTLFMCVNYHASYEPLRAVRTERWKYIRRFDERVSPILPNCDDGETKTLWMKYGWKARKPETEMLYDLFFDPGEVRNLADDAEYHEVLADMRDRLETWMRITADPLLHGPVTAPVDARVNDADGISPHQRLLAPKNSEERV